MTPQRSFMVMDECNRETPARGFATPCTAGRSIRPLPGCGVAVTLHALSEYARSCSMDGSFRGEDNPDPGDSIVARQPGTPTSNAAIASGRHGRCPTTWTFTDDSSDRFASPAICRRHQRLYGRAKSLPISRQNGDRGSS